MSLSQKTIGEFKEICKEEYGKELTDAEASESVNNLVGFFDLLMKISWRDDQRKRRLKTEPEGFHITDGTYNCAICNRLVTGDKSWYDWWGVKCLLCQKAVTDGAVPGFVCTERDSCFKTWQLKDYFGIAYQTAMKQIRQGTLKARVVLAENRKPYEYIFLKKENPHLIYRDSPARKSYDRHRKKESAYRIREARIKERQEKQEIKKKHRNLSK